MLLSTVMVALTMAMAPAPQGPGSGDLDSAYKQLKAAEAKKDVAEIKKWAVETSKLANATKKAPPDPDAEVQKSRLAFAEEVGTYADYAISAAALTSTDSNVVIDLRDTLAAQSPNSKYLPDLNGKYLAALAATGQAAKQYPFAEKAIAKDPNDEALLVILAAGSYERRAYAQAVNYGNRLASASKTPSIIGRGHWFAGMGNMAMQKFGPADKALRASLPLIKGETALYAQALFQLGLADYNLANMLHDRVMMKDAAAFSAECSKLNSPVAGQCAQNASAMSRALATFR